jgi:hypothetical protein
MSLGQYDIKVSYVETFWTKFHVVYVKDLDRTAQ